MQKPFVLHVTRLVRFMSVYGGTLEASTRHGVWEPKVCSNVCKEHVRDVICLQALHDEQA